MRISSREKQLSIGLAVFVGTVTFYMLLVKPSVARLETLERVVPEKLVALHELQSQCRQYVTLQDRIGKLQEQIASGPGDFMLLSFLDGLAEKLKLTDKVVLMKGETRKLDATYTEATVTLELQHVTLKELMEFLSRLRSENSLVTISNLSISRGDTGGAGLLNSTVHVSHLRIGS
jgi:type II secretory pathway component PulM